MHNIRHKHLLTFGLVASVAYDLLKQITSRDLAASNSQSSDCGFAFVSTIKYSTAGISPFFSNMSSGLFRVTHLWNSNIST
jgi:hypothetical protein